MYKRTFASLLAIASLTVVGCSSDSQDSIESDVESAVTEVSAAVEDAATEVSGAVEDAATEVSGAVDDVAQDAAETVARNIATEQGEEQFTNAGHALEGGLECEAMMSDGVDTIDITCTGTTEEGGAAELTGTTTEIPGASVTQLEGDFTGTVDGAEVFTTDTLGG